MSIQVGLQNSQNVPARPLDAARSERLNLYGTYNDTFYEYFSNEKNANRKVIQPTLLPYNFNVLGGNPLNGLITTNPAVVQKDLNQTLNTDPLNTALGNMTSTIPQVGREYTNMTTSYPQHTPGKVYIPSNSESLQVARTVQTRRVY